MTTWNQFFKPPAKSASSKQGKKDKGKAKSANANPCPSPHQKTNTHPSDPAGKDLVVCSDPIVIDLTEPSFVESFRLLVEKAFPDLPKNLQNGTYIYQAILITLTICT